MINLLQECSKAKTIGITGHVRPDGDCVGSCMALYLYLKKNMPQTDITVYLEEAAKTYHHINGVELIDSSFRKKPAYDVFFCLDSAPERTGQAQALYESAAKKINIDHHITNPGCGDINDIHPEIGSTAELVYRLIPEEALDDEIAKAIYIGIIHDTGVFQFSNTLPSTMEAGAKLIQYDIDFANLIQESFYEKSYKQTQIMAEAVLKSKMYLENKCLVSYFTQEEMLAMQAGSADFTGIINRLKTVQGVECAVFMYEIEAGNYKVSLRTSDNVDATAVTTVFGGGGHIKAAGCNIHGTAEQVIEKLTVEIAKQL